MEQVIEHTPNGREIRTDGEFFLVQPINDNYWIKVRTLKLARRAYQHPERFVRDERTGVSKER